MNIRDVTIIMATRNAGNCLQDALESIRDCAPGCQFMVWDGGSTDHTTDLLNAADDIVTKWNSAEDDGIYDAFMKCLDWVDTPLVYFLGADDRLRPEWADMVRTLTDIKCVSYGDVWMKRGRKAYCGKIESREFAGTNLCQQAIFYPTELLRKHPFVLKYKIQADWEFNMWCATQAETSFVYTPYTICTFNDETGASSMGYDQPFNQDYPRLVLEYFGLKAFLRYGVPAGVAHHTRKIRGRS